MDVSGSTNRELFASDNPAMTDNLAAALGKLPQGSLADLMGRVSQGLEAYAAGSHVMTDDKAPVELLGMQVIDELIKEEVAYYKGIYERDGIKGLLDSF